MPMAHDVVKDEQEEFAVVNEEQSVDGKRNYVGEWCYRRKLAI